MNTKRARNNVKIKPPLFSVVIPTKNRPELLRDAIASVLLQDFGDYELIISDNFNDERTKNTVDEFSQDSRLRYFRTERELNMPDHWEWISGKPTGKYVLFLTDRSLFRRGALRKIFDTIKIYEPQGIKTYTWQHAIFDCRKQSVRPVAKISGETTLLSSADLLREYASKQKVNWYFPVALNSCYRRDVADLIKSEHSRLFWPISPDVTSGFLMLSYEDRIVGIGEPLFLMQTASNSNGALRDILGAEIYLRTLNLKDWYRYVPIKVLFNHNYCFEDFLAVRAMTGKVSLYADVDWVNYFSRCYEEFVYFGTNGFIKNRKKEFLEAWENALASFGGDVQAAVREKMLRARIIFTIKAMLANSRWLPFLRRIQSVVSYKKSVKYYASALEAAGFGKKTVINASTVKN